MNTKLCFAWVFLSMVSELAANDTPFLRYNCLLTRPAKEVDFDLKFRNDDSYEKEEWHSAWKSMKIVFEKQNKHAVSVTITTGFGLPVVSNVVPEEYRFKAPLTTPDFDFSVFTRDPTKVGEMLTLTCEKIK